MWLQPRAQDSDAAEVAWFGCLIGHFLIAGFSACSGELTEWWHHVVPRWSTDARLLLVPWRCSVCPTGLHSCARSRFWVQLMRQSSSLHHWCDVDRLQLMTVTSHYVPRPSLPNLMVPFLPDLVIYVKNVFKSVCGLRRRSAHSDIIEQLSWLQLRMYIPGMFYSNT